MLTMVKVATKTCITCHASKPVSLFHQKRNQCKACKYAKQREWKQKNRKKVAEYQREYWRTWQLQNRDKINDTRSKRRKNDPEYNLICALRTRMLAVVKRADLVKKCDSTSELLGISPQGLREWLEAQFTEGMSWENRSDWHVDHRVPCGAFDMTVPEQQRICFWYKNLQPLWAKDNIQKSNTYTEEEKQALISAYCNQ